MADQTSKPGPNDVADGRGRFAPGGPPGGGEMGPDMGVDAAATHAHSDVSASGRRIGTQGAMIEDLADPSADANAPDPSRPITMSTGPQGQPDRGANIPGGGYGDSRQGPEDGRAISDEEAGPGTGAVNAIRSGSHLTEDDTTGTPPGSEAPVENPPVSQPANVTQPRRP